MNLLKMTVRASGIRWVRVLAAILLAVIGLLILVVISRGDEDADTRPNLILILTDDQRWDTLDYMPEVQRHLLGQGVEFTNAFVTSPVCCPSRASILTGQYAHNHGVLTNGPPDGGAEFFDDSSTVATWLHDAGYRTALIGKYLNRYSFDLAPYIPPGWDEWQAFKGSYYNYYLVENGVIVPYGASDSDYSTDVLTAKAVDFIEASDGPFFLYFAPFAPHVPSVAASRHEGVYVDLAPFRPPSFNEGDVSDKPTWQRLEFTPAVQEYADKWRIRQIESLQAVDDAVGAIMAALEERDKDQNTVIIFTSDNGYLWGEHRLRRGKACPFEECIRVPLVMRYPPMISGPRQDSRFILNIDLIPTFAELAGIEIPDTVDGTSIVPLLSEAATPWRHDFLMEYWQHEEDPRSRPTFAAVRGLEWKYIEYMVCPTDSDAAASTASWEMELYNILDDPYELTNLYSQAKYPDQKALEEQLAMRLRELTSDWPPAVRCNAEKERR